jgi:transmembrane sensor
MQVTKALLVKFIVNKCSREEAELVYEYLLTHPEAIDGLLAEEDWDTYDSNGVLDKHQSDAWYAVIQKQKNTGRVISWKGWLRIAAAIILLLTGSVVVYQVVKPVPDKVSQTVTIVRPADKTPQSKQKKFINNSNRPAIYTLTDGSVITLYKQSTVACEQPFAANKRDLVLHGEALFNVAKDKTKPFTVYTKNFSTTALGTVFNISAYDNKTRSGVKLISGKVVVNNLKKATGPVYMNPGDECFFKNSEKKLELHEYKAAALEIKPVTHHDRAITGNEESIEFTNAPLRQVFNKIENLYHVSIHIEAKHLENRKFTGTHLKSESPDELLSTIAGLNNLQLSKEGTVYLLRYNE